MDHLVDHLSGRGTYVANNALLQAQAEHKAVTPLIVRAPHPPGGHRAALQGNARERAIK